jgi:hypothetical protein
MGVERVDYSSDDEYRQALEMEEDVRRQTSWDDEYGISMGCDTAPCYICGKETMTGASPETTLCLQCEPLTGAEKILVINRKMKEEKFSNTP